MIETSWGLKPVLFYIGKFPIQAYPVFVFLALVVGVILYIYQLKSQNIRNINALYILIFAIVGGTIGSKIPILFIYWKEINASPNSLSLLFSGRTITGGLIGGWLGTFLAKKSLKIKERMGNQIAIPVAVGMAIGRIGCLLRGCCYGKPTNLSWGINFGDHILRHPTQIYEMIFNFALAGYLYWRNHKGVEPGELFRIFLTSYLSFRFLIEFVRVEKIAWAGLTAFQLLCVVSLIYINRNNILSVFRRCFRKMLKFN